MPRSVTLIGITFIFVSVSFAQTVSMMPPYMGLSGLIHTVHEEAYTCTGDPAEKPWRVTDVSYDRRGNEIWRAFYNPDGSVGHQASYIFDSGGNATGWAEFYGKNDFPPDGLHKHAVFTLSGGKPISSIVYKGDTPESKTTRDYDERGNKIREVTVQIGCCTTTRTFKYDAQNRLIAWTFDASGLSSVQTRAYDAAGNVINETIYDKGVLAAATVRTYDGGRLIKEVRTSRDGGTRTLLNTYNRLGQLTLTTIDDPSITSRTTFEYFDNGKIRTKDQLTAAKVGGIPQDSEATPTPGRILENYDTNGNQIERYIYDARGELYLTQLSSYDEKGHQIREVDIASSESGYNRDLVYEYDPHGNRIAAFCRSVTPTGEVKLSQSEKRIITYYDK